MTAENAYQEVLRVLPEKIAVSVVDSLANGEYFRREIECLVNLSTRINEKSFSFSDKQLDRQAQKMVALIEQLDSFLDLHYKPLGASGNLFQLYPEHKHEAEIKTSDSEVKSWAELRDYGLHLGREVKSEYEKLIELYQRKQGGKETQIFPHKIPAGTRWADFIFIVNHDDTLTVKVKQHEVTLSFKDIGMVDGRTGEPNIQWGLLKVFATHVGELPASSGDARDNYKKQKQLLSERLQSYFSIDFDPFEPYERAYKTKFTIFVKDETK